MDAQDNVPKKQKVKLSTLTCLFVKRKFNETLKISVPLQQQMWKDDFQFLTLLSTKLQNTLAQNSLGKLAQ